MEEKQLKEDDEEMQDGTYFQDPIGADCVGAIGFAENGHDASLL